MAEMPVCAAIVRRDPVAVRSVVGRWLILVTVVVGLVAMHQLVGAGIHAPHDHAAPAAMSAASHSGATMAVVPAAAVEHCPQPGGSCPGPGHGHPGQVCQPGPGSQAPTGVPALLPVLAVPAAAPAALSPHTAAADAAAGSGCGPPALTELSLLRI